MQTGEKDLQGGNVCGDFGPEVIDEDVDVGEGMELEEGMRLLEERKEATSSRDEGSGHGFSLCGWGGGECLDASASPVIVTVRLLSAGIFSAMSVSCFEEEEEEAPEEPKPEEEEEEEEEEEGQKEK